MLIGCEEAGQLLESPLVQVLVLAAGIQNPGQLVTRLLHNVVTSKFLAAIDGDMHGRTWFALVLRWNNRLRESFRLLNTPLASLLPIAAVITLKDRGGSKIEVLMVFGRA